MATVNILVWGFAVGKHISNKQDYNSWVVLQLVFFKFFLTYQLFLGVFVSLATGLWRVACVPLTVGWLSGAADAVRSLGCMFACSPAPSSDLRWFVFTAVPHSRGYFFPVHQG